MLKIKEIYNKNWGKVFGRITSALKTHAPSGVEFVSGNDYDVCMVHAVGGEEYIKATQEDLSKVILFQHCYYTTNMDLSMWHNLWTQCRCVISFHNLVDYTDTKFNFLRSPLGAEPELFPILNTPRTAKVFSTGHVADTECLDLIYQACRDTKNIMIHTGNNFKWDANGYSYSNYLPDAQYNAVLNKVQYVAGLRLIEGFECHCIEGAMTGAIPIVPDLPTYDWYKDFGIFIDTKQDIKQQLIDIFNNKSYKSLDYGIISYVRERFSYAKIVNDIYKETIL